MTAAKTDRGDPREAPQAHLQLLEVEAFAMVERGHFREALCRQQQPVKVAKPPQPHKALKEAEDLASLDQGDPPRRMRTRRI